MDSNTARQRVKIKDVAERVGVSSAIVSRIMNNDTKLVIKEETRQKVLNAIEEMAYSPNAIARSLRTLQSSMIGVMIVDITNPFICEFIRGVQEVVTDSGRFCFLCESRDDPQTEQKLIKEMYERQAEGVIVATLKMDDPIIPQIKRLGLKCVAATRSVPDLEFPSITFDHKKSIRISMEHVLGLGHTRIGYLAGHTSSYSGATRMELYKKILAENGLEVNQDYIKKCRYFANDGYQAMEKLLSLDTPPTAVIACNDIVAISAIKAASKLGFRVPEDISIVGYNNIDVASLIHPALTTVDTPVYEMGIRAARMMLSLIEGGQVYPRHVVVDTNLIIRDSTSPNR